VLTPDLTHTVKRHTVVKRVIDINDIAFFPNGFPTTILKTARKAAKKAEDARVIVKGNNNELLFLEPYFSFEFSVEVKPQ